MNWLPKRKVIVPVDFSDDSAEALSTALSMVDDPAHVHALHVLLPLDSVSPGVVWGQVSDEAREQAARKYFKEFLEKLDVKGVTTDIRFGDPGLEIADYARKLPADLIVIPSHGYHGVRRLVLGSVTERVIRHAECSVLVLRRRDAR